MVTEQKSLKHANEHAQGLEGGCDFITIVMFSSANGALMSGALMGMCPLLWLQHQMPMVPSPFCLMKPGFN